MTTAYFPDMMPGYTLLFIPSRERERMIIEADCPRGIKPTLNLGFYTILNEHPLFEKLMHQFSTQEAYRALQYESYQDKTSLLLYLNQENQDYKAPPFIEPSDRSYFYIVGPNRAVTDSCLYDRHHSQWYLPKDHPEASKLIKKYTSKKAKTLWIEHRKLISTKNGLGQKVKECFEERGYPPARIITRPGPKSDHTPDPRLTFRMFEARVSKGIITPKTTKQDAAKLICYDLAMLGTRITPSMVLKQLEMVKGTYKTVLQKYYPDRADQ